MPTQASPSKHLVSGKAEEAVAAEQQPPSPHEEHSDHKGGAWCNTPRSGGLRGGSGAGATAPPEVPCAQRQLEGAREHEAAPEEAGAFSPAQPPNVIAGALQPMAMAMTPDSAAAAAAAAADDEPLAEAAQMLEAAREDAVEPEELMDAVSAARLAYAYHPHEISIPPHPYIYPHPLPIAAAAQPPSEPGPTDLDTEALVGLDEEPWAVGALASGLTSATDAALWAGHALREEQYELQLVPLLPASAPAACEWVRQLAVQQEQDAVDAAVAAAAGAQPQPWGLPGQRRYFAMRPDEGCTAGPPAGPAGADRLLAAVALLEPEWTEWDWGA